jgi:hypothetical protein
MAKLPISLCALLLFSFSNVCLGEELIFPFTVDQNTKNEDMSQVPREKDLQNDKWFMSPPTRIELLTYVIDQYFKKEVAEFWKHDSVKIENYFERRSGPSVSVRADADVSFSSTDDMFVAAVRITYLGKPKKPMKEVCSEVLDSVSFPLVGGGYLYQNRFLGPFIQKGADNPEIIRIVGKLRNNFFVTVILEASFDKNFYTMGCYKLPEEKKVHYYKQAYRLER